MKKQWKFFIEENNDQPVTARVIICGHIHGQIYDLYESFLTGDEIPNSRYVFMGDIVDRGYNGVKNIFTFISIKN